jgi:lantibiotic modifying enzyme
LQEVCRDVVQRMTDSILGLASPDRHDRLFPADPKVFVTNPLSVGYGACGVAYVLHKVKGHVPDGVIAWILRQSRDVKTCPPGLYLGLAGVAWVLWDVGRHDEALELMRQNAAHPALEESPDMFYGLAGWGMTQLKFFAATGDRQYLDWAIRAGDTLARTAKEEDGRLHWPDAGGNVVYGFGHGASGISLFLLYLHLATQDEKYLELGRRALDFDLAAAEQNPEGASTWRMRRSPAAPWLPYFRHGTAGVGMAVVRYYWHLREPRYREALDLMLPDVDRKYAIMLGRFTGLTGIGEFLLDLEATEGYESAAREGLKKLVSGLLLFQVETEKVLCFPGYELFRLSCDLATGSAGIALFLHRYLNKHPQAFLVDELFGAGVSRSALDVQAAAS